MKRQSELERRIFYILCFPVNDNEIIEVQRFLWKIHWYSVKLCELSKKKTFENVAALHFHLKWKSRINYSIQKLTKSNGLSSREAISIFAFLKYFSFDCTNNSERSQGKTRKSSQKKIFSHVVVRRARDDEIFTNLKSALMTWCLWFRCSIFFFFLLAFRVAILCQREREREKVSSVVTKRGK